MMNPKAGWTHAPLILADEPVEPELKEPESQMVTVIQPTRGWQLINFRELWHFRELLFHLVWRDVKVRYKQTFLGGAWAILQPATMMVVFTIVFSQIAGLESGNLPYPLFVVAGLLPWIFFSTSVSQAGNSVVNSEHLITKIYFPRLAIPLASVGAGIVDFVIGFGFLVALRGYFWYQGKVSFSVNAQILLAPLIFALIIVAALGVGTLFAALNVAYRDFRYVMPFVIQLWLFATPTIYMEPVRDPHGYQSHTAPTADTSEKSAADPQMVAADNQAGTAASTETGGEPPSKPRPQRKGFSFTGILGEVLSNNPMTGLIAAFRHSLFGEEINWPQLGRSSVMVVLLFLIGTLIFRRVEDTFPDII
jgi:lipopolysaccharide transport system permease protein